MQHFNKYLLEHQLNELFMSSNVDLKQKKRYVKWIKR